MVACPEEAGGNHSLALNVQFQAADTALRPDTLRQISTQTALLNEPGCRPSVARVSNDLAKDLGSGGSD